MVEYPAYPLRLGAIYLGEQQCHFLVWAPQVERLELKLLGTPERLLPMQLRDHGYYELTVEGVSPGTQYSFHLNDLRELGVTAIELMPVAQFPGSRNWGYDGVHPFAVQNTYGGPKGLQRLIDAAHSRDLAVVMDVVYNHLGPEGNYLSEFGCYFTDRDFTPWGKAINFDDRDSEDMRRFVIENALYWINEFHVDALRLDAVHAIFDFSARPFLQELATVVRWASQQLNRCVYTMAESGLNDVRLIAARELGGCGIDAQWCDDLHHALWTELTAERTGYYVDNCGFGDVEILLPPYSVVAYQRID